MDDLHKNIICILSKETPSEYVLYKLFKSKGKPISIPKLAKYCDINQSYLKVVVNRLRKTGIPVEKTAQGYFISQENIDTMLDTLEPIEDRKPKTKNAPTIKGDNTPKDSQKPQENNDKPKANAFNKLSKKPKISQAPTQSSYRPNTQSAYDEGMSDYPPAADEHTDIPLSPAQKKKARERHNLEMENEIVEGNVDLNESIENEMDIEELLSE